MTPSAPYYGHTYLTPLRVIWIIASGSVSACGFHDVAQPPRTKFSVETG